MCCICDAARALRKYQMTVITMGGHVVAHAVETMGLMPWCHGPFTDASRSGYSCVSCTIAMKHPIFHAQLTKVIHRRCLSRDTFIVRHHVGRSIGVAVEGWTGLPWLQVWWLAQSFRAATLAGWRLFVRSSSGVYDDSNAAVFTTRRMACWRFKGHIIGERRWSQSR